MIKKRKETKLGGVIRETFELDKKDGIKFKDDFDSFSILITGDDAKLERTKKK